MKTPTTSIKASTAAFLVVLTVLIVGFTWWFRSRPSFLIFQAHSHMGKQNQSAVIHQYENLLSQKNLPTEEEIKLRLALGEFYLEASGEIGTVVLKQSKSSYGVEHSYLEKAKEQFDRILKIEPGHSLAHFHLGRILMLRGLMNFAKEEFEAAYQFDPGLPHPLGLLAEIELERGQPEKARELSLQALSVDNSYEPARWTLVRSYMILQNHLQAEKEYRVLGDGFKSKSSVRAHYATYLSQMNYGPEAADELAKIERANPNDFHLRLARGKVFLKLGNVEAAFGEFAQAANIKKNSPWPLVFLAQTHANRGDCGRSIQAADILMQALPRWPWSAYAKGWSYLCEGNTTQALELLNESIRRAPHFAEAIDLKARILVDLGKYKTLGEHLRPLLDEKKFRALGYAYLAESLYKQKKYALSEEMALESIKMNDRSFWPYIWLTLSSLAQKKPKTANYYWDQALEFEFPDPEFLGHHGYYLHLVGRKEDVKPIFDDVQQRAPKNPTWLTLKGKTALADGDDNQALQLFQLALDAKPYLLEAQLGLVEAFWNLKNLEAANAALSQALRLNSENQDVLSWKKKLAGSNS